IARELECARDHGVFYATCHFASLYLGHKENTDEFTKRSIRATLSSKSPLSVQSAVHFSKIPIMFTPEDRSALREGLLEAAAADTRITGAAITGRPAHDAEG